MDRNNFLQLTLVNYSITGAGEWGGGYLETRFFTNLSQRLYSHLPAQGDSSITWRLGRGDQLLMSPLLL